MEFSDANFNYDKAYKNMPIVQISSDVSITFFTEEKCDILTIGEDYYEDKGSAVYISKETYALVPNNDGNFELKVTHRNSKRDEKSIYFIKTQDGKQIFSLQFSK